MEPTELLFYVLPFEGHWIVRSEDQRCGPFASYSDALHRAVEEARAAGRYGFASSVLARPAVDGPFEVQWGHDHGAISPDGADALRRGSRRAADGKLHAPLRKGPRSWSITT